MQGLSVLINSRAVGSIHAAVEHGLHAVPSSKQAIRVSHHGDNLCLCHVMQTPLCLCVTSWEHPYVCTSHHGDTPVSVHRIMGTRLHLRHVMGTPPCLCITSQDTPVSVHRIMGTSLCLRITSWEHPCVCASHHGDNPYLHCIMGIRLCLHHIMRTTRDGEV